MIYAKKNASPNYSIPSQISFQTRHHRLWSAWLYLGFQMQGAPDNPSACAANTHPERPGQWALQDIHRPPLLGPESWAQLSGAHKYGCIWTQDVINESIYIYIYLFIFLFIYMYIGIYKHIQQFTQHCRAPCHWEVRTAKASLRQLELHDHHIQRK